jgi:hypothetical protein
MMAITAMTHNRSLAPPPSTITNMWKPHADEVWCGGARLTSEQFKFVNLCQCLVNFAKKQNLNVVLFEGPMFMSK